MDTFKIFIISLIVSCNVAVLHRQNRNVVWIHGLGENETTWDIFDFFRTPGC